MAAPTIAPISVALDDFSGSGRVATPALLGAMLRAAEKISDLIFSPGRPPQVQVYGQMIPVQVHGLTVLTADDTRHIAADLIGDNKQAINTLREHGACDISYGLPRLARFRVNIFIQRGSCAVVMRVIPTNIPDFESLRLPKQLNEVIKLRTTDGATFYIPPRWHRARCLNCGRPLRIYSLSLTTRACCFDCRRQAKNKRNAERRRVRHEPMTCIECGRAFTPKRADAVTCSNRCRQAQHRKRERAELAASGSRYAPAVRARVRSRAPSRR